MRRRNPGEEDEEPSLFDLPLDLPERDRLPPAMGEEDDDFDPAPPVPTPPSRSRSVREERSPATAAVAPAASRERSAPRRPAPLPPTPRAASPEVEPELPQPPGRASLGSRLSAGLADLLVHAAIAAVAFAGARFLGAEPTPTQWPAFALFLAAFSFLYTILPLAFWGQTLGMTWGRLAARDRDGEPLTFDQAARRWLGGLLTTALFGLPLFVAGRGRTLTDLLSGSETYRAD